MRPRFAVPCSSAGARAARLALPALLLVALGCGPIKLIADYDQVIDESATALQQEMDAFLTGLAAKTPANALENPDDVPDEAKYEANKQFYLDYGVKLRSLLMRAELQPKNKQTVGQIEGMIDSLELLRLAHEAGPIDPAVGKTTLEIFNVHWRSIIQLELAKKGGGPVEESEEEEE